MPSMLKFPSKFDRGDLPIVLFTPHKYKFPIPSLTKLTPPAKLPSNNDSVTLYLPGDFSENINASWEPQEVYAGAANNAAAAGVANLTNFAKQVDSGKLVATTEQYTGKIPFPTDTNIFQFISPTALSFAFNMIPFDKDEGDTIVKIIKNFKKAILPTSYSSQNAVILNFPDIWDVQFININGFGLERDLIYEDMALTACSVQYVSGTENASVYHDNNPTQVRLNLTLTSLRKQFLIG